MSLPLGLREVPSFLLEGNVSDQLPTYDDLKRLTAKDISILKKLANHQGNNIKDQRLEAVLADAFGEVDELDADMVNVFRPALPTCPAHHHAAILIPPLQESSDWNALRRCPQRSTEDCVPLSHLSSVQRLFVRAKFVLGRAIEAGVVDPLPPLPNASSDDEPRPDYARCLPLLKSAARAGFSPAQCAFGYRAFILGKTEIGCRWLVTASLYGSPRAMSMVAALLNERLLPEDVFCEFYPECRELLESDRARVLYWMIRASAFFSGIPFLLPENVSDIRPTSEDIAAIPDVAIGAMMQLVADYGATLPAAGELCHASLSPLKTILNSPLHEERHPDISDCTLMVHLSSEDATLARACYVLGRIIDAGKLGAIDFTQSKKYYEKAARAWFAPAASAFAECLVSGKGVATNNLEGAMWYLTAAKHGSVVALRYCASKIETDDFFFFQIFLEFYPEAKAVSANDRHRLSGPFRRAAAWLDPPEFLLAENIGDYIPDEDDLEELTKADIELLELISTRPVPQISYLPYTFEGSKTKDALRLTRVLVAPLDEDYPFDIPSSLPKQLGHLSSFDAFVVRAKYVLGRAVDYGKVSGFPDFCRSRLLFEEAAKAGFAPSMNAIGYCYQKGEGVAANLDLGPAWYICAAQHGSVKAMSNISILVNQKIFNMAVLTQFYPQFSGRLESDEGRDEARVHFLVRAYNPRHLEVSQSLGELLACSQSSRARNHSKAIEVLSTSIPQLRNANIYWVVDSEKALRACLDEASQLYRIEILSEFISSLRKGLSLLDSGVVWVEENDQDDKLDLLRITTVLHECVKTNRIDIIRWLSGTNEFEELLSIKDRDNFTPGELAVSLGRVELAAQLHTSSTRIRALMFCFFTLAQEQRFDFLAGLPLAIVQNVIVPFLSSIPAQQLARLR